MRRPSTCRGWPRLAPPRVRLQQDRPVTDRGNPPDAGLAPGEHPDRPDVRLARCTCPVCSPGAAAAARRGRRRSSMWILTLMIQHPTAPSWCRIFRLRSRTRSKTRPPTSRRGIRCRPLADGYLTSPTIGVSSDENVTGWAIAATVARPPWPRPPKKEDISNREIHARLKPACWTRERRSAGCA